MKFLIKLTLSLILLTISSCIHVKIKGAGVFEGAKSKNDGRYSVIIPVGVYPENIPLITYPPSQAGKKLFDAGDGSKVTFDHLGRCGAQLSFTGIVIPIVPFWLPNFCESDGLYIDPKWYADTLGITLQLHYNSTIHDPYIENGSVKFKIKDFSEFKKAPDKSLILHKRNPDGTIFTKELPFDWKIVTEVSGGL